MKSNSYKPYSNFGIKLQTELSKIAAIKPAVTEILLYTNFHADSILGIDQMLLELIKWIISIWIPACEKNKTFYF